MALSLLANMHHVKIEHVGHWFFRKIRKIKKDDNK
jgi:hypothetical protein